MEQTKEGIIYKTDTLKYAGFRRKGCGRLGTENFSEDQNEVFILSGKKYASLSFRNVYAKKQDYELVVLTPIEVAKALTNKHNKPIKGRGYNVIVRPQKILSKDDDYGTFLKLVSYSKPKHPEYNEGEHPKLTSITRVKKIKNHTQEKEHKRGLVTKTIPAVFNAIDASGNETHFLEIQNKGKQSEFKDEIGAIMLNARYKPENEYAYTLYIK